MENILSRNGASEYGPGGTTSVPRGAPMRHAEWAELLLRQTQGCLLRKTQGCQGDILVCLGWEKSVILPSALVNNSTKHSQEYTLLALSDKENQGFCRTPWGHPESHSTKVTPAEYDHQLAEKQFLLDNSREARHSQTHKNRWCLQF